jgi:hypothetical protein
VDLRAQQRVGGQVLGALGEVEEDRAGLRAKCSGVRVSPANRSSSTRSYVAPTWSSITRTFRQLPEEGCS